MSVSIRSLRIPQNHVLVKPDEDHQTFKTKGGLELHVARHEISSEEKEIAQRKDGDFIAKHYSITGKVILIPEQMVYHGYQVKKLKKPYTKGERIPLHIQKQIMMLTQASLELDTECEVNPGDKIWFHYMEHLNCAQQGRVIDTIEHGECYLMKYDSLFCYERNGNQVPINGWVWIQQQRYSPEETKTASGIILSTLEGKPKKNHAVIIASAKPIRDYLDSEYCDGDVELLPGMHIYYNSKHGTPLEHEYHITAGVPDVIKIRRRYILGILPEKHEKIEDITLVA